MKHNLSSNRIFLFIVGILFTCLQFSCSVEKRLHMPGYHVNWHQWKHNSISQEKATNNPNKNISHPQSDSPFHTLTASADNSIVLLNPKRIKSNPSDECDIIILRNGNEIKAKIIEIGITEIKYKKCDYADGPTYTALKSDVFMIKYANGSKDVFSDTEQKVQPETKKEPEYKVESKPESKIEELSYAERYMKGQTDAGQYHNGGGWYAAGIFLGLIGVLIAALSNPVPHTYNNELSNDMAYREGYKKAARKQNILNAVYGWLIFLVFFFIIIGAAYA